MSPEVQAAEVAGGKRIQRGHRAEQRLELGEEPLIEPQRRGGAVNEEVEPLDGGIDGSY